MFCLFSCFIFWRCLFFLLVDSKNYCLLCNINDAEKVVTRITLLFKILLLPILSLRFLFLLYAIIGISWSVFFILGLICNKCQFLSMIYLMLGRALLNFSTSGIIVLFGILGFEINKASLVTSDVLLGSVGKCST